MLRSVKLEMKYLVFLILINFVSGNCCAAIEKDSKKNQMNQVCQSIAIGGKYAEEKIRNLSPRILSQYIEEDCLGYFLSLPELKGDPSVGRILIQKKIYEAIGNKLKNPMENCALNIRKIKSKIERHLKFGKHQSAMEFVISGNKLNSLSIDRFYANISEFLIKKVNDENFRGLLRGEELSVNYEIKKEYLVHNRSPLYVSAYALNMNMLSYLINNKYNVNQIGIYCSTPIYGALGVSQQGPSDFSNDITSTNKERYATIQTLINNGADLNWTNIYGMTPAHVAAFYNNIDYFKLVKTKENIKTKDVLGLTPFDYFRLNGRNIFIVKLSLFFNQKTNLIYFSSILVVFNLAGIVLIVRFVVESRKYGCKGQKFHP